MSDYYISEINKTFFLSGSLIYHTDNSGSNADKNNGTLLQKEYLFIDDRINVVNWVSMSIDVSGSMYYLKDKGILE
tara:strand:- start:812 stop:1039 length:228 start_codon:yes stop_codon:yes gene_type:complete